MIRPNPEYFLDLYVFLIPLLSNIYDYFHQAIQHVTETHILHTSEPCDGTEVKLTHHFVIP